jgi:membrane-bound lytic murein transglycosylase D
MNFLSLAAAATLVLASGCSATIPVSSVDAPAADGAAAPESAPVAAAVTHAAPQLDAPVAAGGTHAAPQLDAPVASAAPSPPLPVATAPLLQPLAPLSVHFAGPLNVVPLAPPPDLWERIRRGYAMPDLQSDLVRDREQWYVSRPESMGRMTERASKYMFHIVEELERRNMPTELALLPFIESAFNPQAVSSAKAAGMWQFMPATGKSYELKQNAFRDDRRDVLASTRAALDYLQKLYGMFGDWHLALAAYNWGEGSVGRAIAKNQRANLGTGYLDLVMPAETRMYVPKLQAIKNLVSAPQNFGATLPVIENHPYFQSVTLTRDIDVALTARLAEVKLEDFKALNPSLSRPVILAAGTPQILLPWDNAAIFSANLLAQGNSQLSTWTAWRAPANMKPAEAAKRVGMSEPDLRSTNNIPNGVMIKAGSTLLVARSASVRQDVTGHVADTAQLTLSPLPLLARRSVRAVKGDTVASLARRYKVPAASIAEWNGTTLASAFKPGQSVTLYGAARAGKSAVATAGVGKAAKARAGKGTGTGKPVQVAHR